MSKHVHRFWRFLAGSGFFLSISFTACAFEGHIRAAAGPGGAPSELLYTIGTNCLRVEMLDTNFPNPVDIFDFNSDLVTVVTPMNSTFVRFKLVNQTSAGMPPGFPGAAGGPPPGIGPQSQPGNPSAPPPMPPRLPPGIGPTNFPGMPAPPSMPQPPGGLPPGAGSQAPPPAAPGAPAAPNFPSMPGNSGISAMPAMAAAPRAAPLELRATGEKSNILNYSCERYEIKQRGQTMEIWATDQLSPFIAYLPNQPPGIGPQIIERQWSSTLAGKNLFPLRASLRMENGVERYHFEVESITPGKLTKDDLRGFEPPAGYVEVQPRPF